MMEPAWFERVGDEVWARWFLPNGREVAVAKNSMTCGRVELALITNDGFDIWDADVRTPERLEELLCWISQLESPHKEEVLVA